MVTINKFQLQNAMDRLNDRLADVEAKETHGCRPMSNPITKPTAVAAAYVAPVVHVDPADLVVRERLAALQAENARLKTAAQARRVSAAMRRKYDFDQIPVNGSIEVPVSEGANLRSCLAGAKNGYLKGRDVLFVTRTVNDKVFCFRVK